MKTKVLSLCVALLTGISVWADVTQVSIFDDCSKNGQTVDACIGQEHGYAWVSLDLPSGVKWATCNIGTDSIEGYGNYYAWGEVLPKDDYWWNTYKYGSSNNLTKYNNTDGKTTLEFEDDAAHVNWGGSWRMPTDAEWTELRENCMWTWTTHNSVNGYLVTSKTNGNSIFLPVAGYRFGTDFSDSAGRYWSSSLCTDDQSRAWGMCFGSRRWYVNSPYRYFGQSVRPVCLSVSMPPLSENTFVTLTLSTVGCESANTIRCAVGLQVNVSAIPENEHRHFVRWSDGNTDNPRLVTVTQDMTLTAEFADDPILTLVSSNDSRGQISGAGQFKPNTSCQIYAISYHGYHFVQWTDGNTDNPRTIVLTNDTTFTAEFAQTFSGQCGYDLYWQYAGHTLTISGTGAMYDYNGNDMPWLLFRDTTDAVVLESGITRIGNNAFNGFVKLGKIDLPSTLTSVGANVFAGCRRLYDIYAYPTEPPVADNTSFANYNVNLYVPCDNLRDYQMDAVFGTFKYIQCMSATDTEQVSADETTDHAAQKVFRNGQVYILREGVLYTLTGIEVK